MSLIPTPTPAAQLTPQQHAIARMASAADDAYNRFLASFALAVQSVWSNANPQSMIDAMGTDAGNNCAASALSGAFLKQISPLIFPAALDSKNQAQLAALEKLVRPTTTAANGTVTITPPAPVSVKVAP